MIIYKNTFEKYIMDVSHSNYNKYGKEKTVVIINI